MATLLIVSSAPAARDAERLLLDKKFHEGMQVYCKAWGGPVKCILREADESRIPFGEFFEVGDLPYAVNIVTPDHKLTRDDMQSADVIMCGVDSDKGLHIPDLTDAKLVYTIENIIQTRRLIISLDRQLNLPRKLVRIARLFPQEWRRRRAMQRADGLQANGFPAFEDYRGLNANAMMYLDNRIKADLFVTDQEMAARAKHIQDGGQLRIVHSGRLETLKGSQDLIPIARKLRDLGVSFHLSIFGPGSLADEIARSIQEHGLQESVALKGSVDFETELVPFVRQNADIFLSCHRQSDPSCTYLENFGCGVPVVGYDNRMLEALSKDSQAGRVVAMGQTDQLANVIAGLDADRAQLVGLCRNAKDYAETNLFEKEFQRRIDHLKALI